MEGKENYIFWKDFWRSMGESESNDLLYLSGGAHVKTLPSPDEVCAKIIEFMHIEKADMVLEVGCAAGFLASPLKDKCIYIGSDYDSGLIKKFRECLNSAAFVCEANSLLFPSKSFDKVFCNGVSQYFPNKLYAYEAFKEMERVAKGCVLVSDIKSESRNDRHLIFSREEMVELGYEISNCFHDSSCSYRFNALKRL